MKTVYIGAMDELSDALIERLIQEGNDVYFLSDENLPRKRGIYRKARLYKIPKKDEDLQKLLQSISPECVIFAGNHFFYDDGRKNFDQDVTLLARTLRTLPESHLIRFILLSSIEVYGGNTGLIDESQDCLPNSERGVRFFREEELLGVYRKRDNIDAAILRVSQLYTDHPEEGGEDFLSRIITASIQRKSSLADDVLQPLYVSDLVDAIMRVMNGGYQYIYNVCGNLVISTKCLYERIFGIDRTEQSVRWGMAASLSRVDSSLIRRELGWSDRHDILNQLQNREIVFKSAPKAKESKAKKAIPTFLRQCLENALIFAVFFCFELLCSQYEPFSQINWMLIYIIIIAISYNIYWSALASILASIGYIFINGSGGIELSTFYAYAGNMITVFEFVFIGLIVSYTINKLKEDKRSVRLDLAMLEEEYEDLKSINEENVLIKNEYEERLLATKSGLPNLYHLVSRLMVQEPDRILMETMNVISELVHTDTVAVYKGDAGSPWVRLIGALNPFSAMYGNSWNLSDNPKIYDAVLRGELYQGELGSGEPAVVLPIVCDNAPYALILIKELPFESESLYYINLMKTLSLLLRDSMEKALQYEQASREDNYIEGTDILKPEAFRRQIALAEEKYEKGIASYCVVRLLSADSVKVTAKAIDGLLRGTDCIGINEDAQLFALLNNTESENLAYLQKRLLARGAEIQLDPVDPLKI